jgi:hypothetical protein
MLLWLLNIFSMEKSIKIFRKNLLDFLGRISIKNLHKFYFNLLIMEKPIESLIQTLLWQKKKILSSDDLKKYIYLAFWEFTQISKIYKITFQLKNRWFLFPLRKDLFYITNPKKPITAEEIEELRYRKLLKDHCNWVCKQRYIWGLTALEIHLHWTWVTIPETVMIINKEKQAIETVVFEKQIAFKKFETKWKNLIPQLIKETIEVNMPNCKNLLIAKPELSILECLYNFDTTNKWYIEECIKKLIKKNGKTLNIFTLETIIKLWKHNTSLNRLYNLTKLVYPTLSEEIKKLIKKYWFLL